MNSNNEWTSDEWKDKKNAESGGDNSEEEMYEVFAEMFGELEDQPSDSEEELESLAPLPLPSISSRRVGY